MSNRGILLLGKEPAIEVNSSMMFPEFYLKLTYFMGKTV